MPRLTRYVLVLAILFPLLGSEGGSRQAIAQFVRPVEVVPPDEDIGADYRTPDVQRPLPRAAWWNVVDVAALLVALGLSTWVVLRRRNRYWLAGLTIACLAYFGFYRQGCVCPIGAIQNVTLSIVDPTYVLPVVVIVFFLLPLVFALFFGRVFCGGVCPLGAIQDLVLLKPVDVPRRWDKSLGALKYVYLALGVWFAAGAVMGVAAPGGREFIICRFDPFVGFFRFTGSAGVLLFGGALLVIGLWIGRPYCRYLCPYGALLGILSRFAWRGVSITPDKELDCGLCTEACPFGAIEKNRAVLSTCLFCARCFDWCPRDASNLSKCQSCDDAASNTEAMPAESRPAGDGP